MRIDDIVVGGIYRNGKQVRKIVEKKNGNITYECLEGRRQGKKAHCWITTMADWAKERIDNGAV